MGRFELDPPALSEVRTEIESLDHSRNTYTQYSWQHWCGCLSARCPRSAMSPPMTREWSEPSRPSRRKSALAGNASADDNPVTEPAFNLYPS
jgi:hypothetical protein